ncbi:hypothetical protein HY989_00575 [Candidatus Micrarchaeota archaeon]|nr:hypothetical protein [Candidatus Micrarchaeota archaeon]
MSPEKALADVFHLKINDGEMRRFNIIGAPTGTSRDPMDQETKERVSPILENVLSGVNKNGQIFTEGRNIVGRLPEKFNKSAKAIGGSELKLVKETDYDSLRALAQLRSISQIVEDGIADSLKLSKDILRQRGKSGQLPQISYTPMSFETKREILRRLRMKTENRMIAGSKEHAEAYLNLNGLIMGAELLLRERIKKRTNKIKTKEKPLTLITPSVRASQIYHYLMEPQSAINSINRYKNILPIHWKTILDASHAEYAKELERQGKK